MIHFTEEALEGAGVLAAVLAVGGTAWILFRVVTGM